MIRCLGCGVIMQNEDSKKEGYTKDLNNKFCERCFQIKHYNNYSFSSKDNLEYLKNIEKINKTGDLVLLVTDFLNLYNLNDIEIKNPIILVITKKDILPKSIDDEYFLKKIKLNVVGKIFVSGKNNYHLDELYDMILKNKKSDNVYVVGFTNAGKSTLINKFLKNYGGMPEDITTSNLPSTTLCMNPIKVNDDLTLIDTPGILDEGSIYLKANFEQLKRILPRKTIRPITYQIKHFQTLFIDDFASLTLDDNNITLYMSNDLKLERFYKDKVKEDFVYYDIDIKSGYDLVIKGLGFIKFMKSGHIKLGLLKDVSFEVRISII